MNTYEAKCSECCEEPGTCLLSCFCPCVVYGQNVEKGLGDNCCVNCLLYFVACNWLGCIGTAIMGSLFRSRYQQRHQLMPDNDCLCHCCCHPCALTQDSREIAIRASRGAGVVTGVPTQQKM